MIDLTAIRPCSRSNRPEKLGADLEFNNVLKHFFEVNIAKFESLKKINKS